MSKRDFNKWISGFRNSIADFGYYIDFGKVYRNVESIKIELNILSDVHDFCIANGIHYILFAGSLLGAIRHKGIIPWDDDLDIAMPRPDYDRFVATYQNNRYIVKTIDNSEDFVFTFSKVIDNSTVLIENKTEQSKIGINIDIFPLDGLPGDEDEAEKTAEK